MTLSISLGARAAMLDGFEAFMVAGSLQASLTIYQTNTALAVFNLGASSTGTPFGTAANDSMALASSTYTVPILNTGTAVAGTANRFILVGQVPSTALSGTISAVGGGGDIETPSLLVTAAAVQRLNTFNLRISPTGLLSVEGSFTLA